MLRAWDPVAVVLRDTPWEVTSRPPPFFTAWSALAADHADPWQPLVTSWLDREARLIELSSGSTHDPPVLSHLDLRADNIVLSDAPADQDVWFVDWAHPGLAACWVDLALLLADVVGSGADASTGGPIDVMERLATAPDRLPVRPRAADLRGVRSGRRPAPAGPATRRPAAAPPEPLGGGDVRADGAVRPPAHRRGGVAEPSPRGLRQDQGQPRIGQDLRHVGQERRALLRRRPAGGRTTRPAWSPSAARSARPRRCRPPTAGGRSGRRTGCRPRPG